MNETSSVEAAASTAPARVPKASIGRRFLANFIDQIIIAVATGCLSSAFGLVVSMGGARWWSDLAGGIVLLIEAMYFIWPYSTDGQTIGKRVMKIKVVSCDGSPLNWGKGLLRTVGYVLSTIPFGFGFLWALWDPDKQAGHDKIAGTYVVPASPAPEIVQDTLSPEARHRTRLAWLVGLTVPTLLMVAAFFAVIRNAVSEVTRMGPWPEPQAQARDLVTVDLSSLGLAPGPVEDARTAQVWTGASYTEGALATYSSGGQTVVSIWALKYADRSVAAEDFGVVKSSMDDPGACGISTYATLWGSGVLHCQYGGGYQKVFWNDRWIVAVEALDGTGNSSDVLIDLVRDALAAHWKEIPRATF